MTEDSGQPFKVLICGSRDWQRVAAVHAVLTRYRERHGAMLAVIHGDCPTGADRAARSWCELYGVCEIRFPAHWDALKRAAGPIRNGHMLTFGEPDVVWAFRQSPQSSGTNGMIGLADAAYLPHYIMEADGRVATHHLDALPVSSQREYSESY